jgi:hypothetical protein
MFQSLNSFFARSEMEKKLVVDPTYTLPEIVILPSTLRRSARFNGYVPGRYYESD